jgi:hypothetical protein
MKLWEDVSNSKSMDDYEKKIVMGITVFGRET